MILFSPEVMKGEQEDEQDGDEANGEGEKPDSRVHEADDDPERLDLVPRGIRRVREIERSR